MSKNSGQVILTLILVMTVALAIGLSIIQKSLVDVSTSSKVEQSQKAFSAAEAGVENALKGNITPINFSQSGASANVSITPSLPQIPTTSGEKQLPLEYPPFSKEDIAQVWLADPESSSNPPNEYYKKSDVDIFWGSPTANVADKPALEIKVTKFESGSYQIQSFFLDSVGSRSSANGFSDASSSCNSPTPVTTILGSSRAFLCKSTLSGFSGKLILLRARFLYSPTSQPFAVQATGVVGSGCNGGGSGCFLPPQATIIGSQGSSGETQRTVQVFKLNKVVPSYFDYAIFSAAEINK